MELGITGGGGSIGDGIGDDVKAVDNGVGWCDSWDDEIVVTEVECVGDAEGLGFGINDAISAIMLEGNANVNQSEPWKSQMWQVAGLLWMMTGQPSGRRGVAL